MKVSCGNSKSQFSIRVNQTYYFSWEKILFLFCASWTLFSYKTEEHNSFLHSFNCWLLVGYLSRIFTCFLIEIITHYYNLCAFVFRQIREKYMALRGRIKYALVLLAREDMLPFYFQL